MLKPSLILIVILIFVSCGHYKKSWQYRKTRAAKHRSWQKQRDKNNQYHKKYAKQYEQQGYDDEYNYKNSYYKKRQVYNQIVSSKTKNQQKVSALSRRGNRNKKSQQIKSKKIVIVNEIEDQQKLNEIVDITVPDNISATNQLIIIKNQQIEQIEQQQIQEEKDTKVVEEQIKQKVDSKIVIDSPNQKFQTIAASSTEGVKPVKKIQPVQSPKIIKETDENKKPKVEFQCSQKPIYDYNLLVLTWIPVNCYGDEQCEKDWLSQQDFRSPTIHAFRPYGSSSYYQSCFGSKGDPNCQTNAYLMNFDIDEALWNVTGLLYQISQYWPALKFTHDEQAFYSQQWQMHGSCYLMNMIEDNPNAYKYDRASFNRTIMVEYFRTTLSKFKQLGIKVEPGAQYNEKQDFAADIGFKGKQTHFALSCDENNEVNQITFCFNRSKLPGKQVTIPCTLADTCDENRKLRLKQPK